MKDKKNTASQAAKAEEVKAAQAEETAQAGEPAVETEQEKAAEITITREKLEELNGQLARRKANRRKCLFWALLALCLIVVAQLAGLYAAHSPYLGWNVQDPEIAVAAASLHGFEWVFVRAAPLLLAGAVAGLILLRKKK